MSNSTRSTSYDERYVVPLEASRRGAHRARVNPVMAALPVVAVAGIVVGAIALVYVVFGSLGGGTDSAEPPAQTSAAPGTTAPAAGPSPSDGAGSQAAAPTSAAVAGTVDKTTEIAVFNGSGTSGLGRTGGEKLRAAGFTVGEPATWNGAAMRTTTVFYPDAAHRATALAVVKALGHGQAKLWDKANSPVTVVIGRDFAGTTSTRTRTPAGSTPTRSTGTGGGAPSSTAKPTTQAPPAPTTEPPPA